MSANRPRRAAAQASSSSLTSAPSAPSGSISRQRSTRSLKQSEPEPEPEPEVDEEDADEEDSEDEPSQAGPSRSSKRSQPQPSPRKSAPVRGVKRGRVQAETLENPDTEDEVMATPGKRTRLKKSVSYKEIPIEADVEEEEDEEEDDVEDDVEEEEEQDQSEKQDRSSGCHPDSAVIDSSSLGRPRSTRATSTPHPKASSPIEKPGFEKIGSGRGGFSVKGAASAAAKARWAKVRRERAERGEDDDDDRVRRRPGGARQSMRSAAAIETYEPGATITIKGVEYTVGDDELDLPDNEKGDAKIDALGRLLGGREYKFQTFTSPTRRNPDRLYGLTIDIARTCGYSDSLAFLRRCPQVLKLSCNAEEREMLIDIGRVSGNLKNRMVTITTMRNAFKMMGARLVKDGKWVTDDYDEVESLAKCEDAGFTPYALAYDDEIIANAQTSFAPINRPSTSFLTSTMDASTARAVALTPFYTVGGPTTHFGGSGIDPWSDAGWGNKRTKLRGIGVGEHDWMLRTAEEGRAVDRHLREFRDERLKVLQGVDATRGWVYAQESKSERLQVNGTHAPQSNGVKEGHTESLRPAPERKKSTLNREITEEIMTPLADTPNGDADGDTEMKDEEQDGSNKTKSEVGDETVEVEVEKTPGGTIVIEAADERAAYDAKYNWGLGSWTPGTIKAVYEVSSDQLMHRRAHAPKPHTHLPHVPLHTQPTSAAISQLSPYPIVSFQSDPSHRNFVQSTITGKAARGISSIEHVFEQSRDSQPLPGVSPGGDDVWELGMRLGKDEENQKRMREVEDAMRWEVEGRKRQKAAAGIANGT